MAPTETWFSASTASAATTAPSVSITSRSLRLVARNSSSTPPAIIRPAIFGFISESSVSDVRYETCTPARSGSGGSAGLVPDVADAAFADEAEYRRPDDCGRGAAAVSRDQAQTATGDADAGRGGGRAGCAGAEPHLSGSHAHQLPLRGQATRKHQRAAIVCGPVIVRKALVRLLGERALAPTAGGAAEMGDAG